MDLDTLHWRVVDEYAERDDRVSKPVKIMTPDGQRFDILSLNWDDEAGEWVLCGSDD
jgi:hypothetical protein